MRGRRGLAGSLLVLVSGLIGLLLLTEPSTAALSEADEVILVEPGGKWHVRQPGRADYVFWYGITGDVPLLGDWDGDGWDTPGMYRPSNGFVYLTNVLPPNGGVGFGDPALTFFFGMAGDQVVVGDWDKDGIDTLGIRRNGRMYLINRNATGVADLDFWFGHPADVGFGGDADGDGEDVVFVYRPQNSFVYYTNVMPAGSGSVAFTNGEFFFGVPTDRFVIGDWDGDGDDTVGVYRPGETRVYLRNTLNTGPADEAYVWGHSSWIPVAGRVEINRAPPSTTTSLLPPTTTTMPPAATTTTTTTTLPPPGSLPIRVNAGGPRLAATDGGPDWLQDTAASPSPYVNVNAGDPNNTVVGWPTAPSGSSVPASTPGAVFGTERYDAAGGPAMRWNFPLDPDQWVEVRLYFASGFPGASDIAERLFDVTVDDWQVLDNYDIVADAGHRIGVMKRFTVKTDADGLDIHFAHGDPAMQNPLINAIEIVEPERLVVVSGWPSIEPGTWGGALQGALAQVAAYPKGPGSEWVVKLEPGSYWISQQLVMEPFVEIEGSGKGRTIIGSGYLPAGQDVVLGADNSTIRHLTIELHDDDWNERFGVLNEGTSPQIENVELELWGTGVTGIGNIDSSTRILGLDVRSFPAGGTHIGIKNTRSTTVISSADLSMGTVGIAGSSVGISSTDSDVTIASSVITTTNTQWGSTGVSSYGSTVLVKEVAIDSSGGYHTASGIFGSQSHLEVEDSSITSANTSTTSLAVNLYDSTATISNTNLETTDGDPPITMWLRGSAVTITGSTIASFENAYSTGRGIQIDDGTLPFEVWVKNSTVSAPTWIASNQSSYPLHFENGTLDGGPIMGAGLTTCLNVTDEHGAFYPNTCPN